MNIAVFLILVGLSSGYGKRYITVQFAHGQTGDFSHGGVVLLDAEDKV